eukprot:gene8247-9799_t
MASRRGLKTKARLTDEEYGNFPPEKTSWSHDEQSMLYFKICVVGGAGVGKSTLIQVLTNAVGTVPQVTRSFDDSHKFALTFTNNIRPRTVVCTLVDSPAVHGDSTDLQGDIDRVTAYIKDCVKPKERPSNLDFSAHQFLIPVSDGDSCNRVDCCLYILPPHRLTAADSEALLQLSELVAIIPVISRADALSPVEKALLRTHVLEDLRQELDSDAAEPRISSTSTRGQIVPAVRSHIRGPVQLFLAEPQLPGATSTGTWEVVVEETVPWVVIWVSSELLHPSGSADADDVDCTPIVTSLPMYGTLYQ